MATRMRAKQTKRRPTAVQFLGGTGCKAPSIVAPKTKARQTQRQASAQLRLHAHIRCFGVTAPMQRITLAARPSAARPDDLVTCDLFGDVGYNFIVAQWIEVVLVKAAAAIGGLLHQSQP